MAPNNLKSICKFITNFFTRTRKTLFFFLLFLACFCVLPQKGTASIFSWGYIALTISLYIVFVIFVVTAPRINNILKNLAALGFFVLLAFLFVRYSNTRWDKIGKIFFDFSILAKANPMFASGKSTNLQLMVNALFVTLKIFFSSAVLSTVLGLALAVVRTIVNDRVLNAVIIVFIDICRSVPMMVFLVIIYSALPFTGIILSPTMSGIITLSMIESAYLCEVFRSGISSVHAVQTEAARALGLNAWQTMRLVVLPQAIITIIAPYTNSLVGLMKATALCSSITIYELIKTAYEIQAWYASPTPLVIASIAYLILLLPLTRFSGYVETKWKKRSI